MAAMIGSGEGLIIENCRNRCAAIRRAGAQNICIIYMFSRGSKTAPQPGRVAPRSRSGRGPPAMAGSIKLARHAAGVVGVVEGAVGAGHARGGEIPQGRNAFRAAVAARLPQIGANERLRTVMEGLLDPDHDDRRRLLAVDGKAAPQERVGADPGAAV